MQFHHRDATAQLLQLKTFPLTQFLFAHTLPSTCSSKSPNFTFFFAFESPSPLLQGCARMKIRRSPYCTCLSLNRGCCWVSVSRQHAEMLLSATKPVIHHQPASTNEHTLTVQAHTLTHTHILSQPGLYSCITCILK